LLPAAANPKERRRYDSKCKELTKQLEQKVVYCNKLLPYGQLPGRVQPSIDQLKSQQFCWVEEYAGVRMHSYSLCAPQGCEDHPQRMFKGPAQPAKFAAAKAWFYVTVVRC
jgi:hypothetical protein